jgi:hypothetical protein
MMEDCFLCYFLPMIVAEPGALQPPAAETDYAVLHFLSLPVDCLPLDSLYRTEQEHSHSENTQPLAVEVPPDSEGISEKADSDMTEP